MQVRSPGTPDDDHDPEADQFVHADEVEFSARVPPRADDVAFMVPTNVIVMKLGLAAMVAVLGLIGASRSHMVAGLIAAAAVAIYAARDLVVRERLRADRDGVVAARGYAGRRRLAWSEIERVRVDARRRLGASTELLEIDAGDEIYLFSRYDLGVDPPDAALALKELRRSAA